MMEVNFRFEYLAAMGKFSPCSQCDIMLGLARCYYVVTSAKSSFGLK